MTSFWVLTRRLADGDERMEGAFIISTGRSRTPQRIGYLLKWGMARYTGESRASSGREGLRGARVRKEPEESWEEVEKLGPYQLCEQVLALAGVATVCTLLFALVRTGSAPPGSPEPMAGGRHTCAHAPRGAHGQRGAAAGHQQWARGYHAPGEVRVRPATASRALQGAEAAPMLSPR